MLPKTKEMRNYYFKRGWSFEDLKKLEKARMEMGYPGWGLI